MFVFLLSAFFGLQIRRAYRPKQESTKHGGATTSVRPGFGSSAGCFSLRLPGEGGTPLTPGGLGRRRRQPPPGPGRTTTTPRQPPLPAKRNGRARARTPRATGTSPARARAARTRRVFRRATGASCGAQNGASPGALNGASPDTRTSASSGAHPARLRGVRSVPGHALHEKGLQRQKGVGPLVSSQGGRALLDPRINRG